VAKKNQKDRKIHMKKFKDISEQYREEGRHKLIQPKNKAVVSPRPESDSAKVKLGEEMQTPSIAVRSLYTKMYAKHGGTASKAKDAQSKAYSEVEKKHGKEMRDSLEAFHKKNMNEAVKDKFDIGEYDQEGDMAKSDLRSILANAKRVHDMLEDSDNLPEWVQSKITKAEDYMSTVANYMEAEMNEEVELDEVSSDMVKRARDAAFAKGKDKQAFRFVKKAYEKGKKESDEIGRKMAEDVELDEENKPTNPELWSRAVSMAKSKFDVYPSAYANGWAAKWYKSKGGGWKSVNEENYEVTVMHTTKDGEKGEHTHKVMNADDARHAKNIALQKHDKMLKSKGVEIRGMGTTTSKVMEQKDDTPFKADKPEKQIATPGKYGAGYSAARHLARMAMQKQIEKQKKPVKEQKDDLPFKADKPKKQSVIPGKYGAGYSMARQLARQAMQKQIEKMKKKPVKEETNKAKIVKDMMKKKKSSEDAFQKDPELSSTLTKGF
jgi:hypothetical protein